MFKQIKSALFWYYLYKFRKKVLIIVFLLLVAIFANMIYADVVEYLTLKNRLEYLEIALISKWGIIIFNLLFSVYLILSLFKLEESKKNNEKENKNDVIIDKDQERKEKTFSKREEEFLNKDLKSKADILVER